MRDDSPSTSPVERRATAREFFAVLFRRKWIILGLFLVTTGTILALALTRKVNYMSTGRVLVRRGEQTSLLNPYRYTQSWEEELASEVEVVRSFPVAQRAQQILNDRVRGGGPAVLLDLGSVDVEVVGQSNVVLIAYLHDRPAEAQAACDAVITAYVEHRESTLNLIYPREFFDSVIDSVDRELTRWEIARRAFMTRSGITDVGDHRRYLLGQQQQLQQNASTITADIEEARMGRQVMEELRKDPRMDVPALQMGYLNEEALGTLTRKMVEQEANIAKLREQYTDEAPEVVNARATLLSLGDVLRREVDARLQATRLKVATLESRLTSLNRDLARIDRDLATLPETQKSLSEMDLEIEVLKQRYQDLIQDADKARINQQTSPRTHVMVLTPAQPATPRNTRDYVRLALAPAFSLVVGVGIAFFVDGLDSRVRSTQDVESRLDLPVLASITEQRRRRRRPV